MAEPTLEERVATLEKMVAEMAGQRSGSADPPPKKWWEPIAGIMRDTPETDEMKAVREYIRVTGDSPPPGWKPGDPIPTPDWWGPEPSDGANP